jgi:hypothetical protein
VKLSQLASLVIPAFFEARLLRFKNHLPAPTSRFWLGSCIILDLHAVDPMASAPFAETFHIDLRLVGADVTLARVYRACIYETELRLFRHY